MYKNEFKLKHSTSNLYLCMSIFGIAFFILFILIEATNGGSVLFFGIFSLVFYFWSKDRIVLSFKDSHLEIKMAPAAPLLLIFYKDIKSVSEIKSEVYLIKYNVNGSEKNYKLNLRVFEDADRQNLLKQLLSCNKKDF